VSTSSTLPRNHAFSYLGGNCGVLLGHRDTGFQRLLCKLRVVAQIRFHFLWAHRSESEWVPRP